MRRNFFVLFFSLFFIFNIGLNKVEAANSCVGQWPGSTMDLDIYNLDTGAQIGRHFHAEDPGSTGSSSDTGSISVDYGTNLRFVFSAIAPENGSPSTLYYPDNSTGFSEGLFSYVRTYDSTIPITYNTFYDWQIEGGCSSATSDPGWDGGRGNIHVDINVNPAAVNGVCGTANRAYPAGATSYGGDTYCSSGAPSATPAFPSPGNSVSWTCLGANGGSNSPQCSASVPAVAMYRCSGGGSCIRDDISGNTNSPTCNNSCALPPTPPTAVANISSLTVRPDNVTPYMISVTGTDSTGASNVSHLYGLINGQGANGGQFRGYVTWYRDANAWPTSQDNRACTGVGGYAAVQSVAPNDSYGHQYIHMDSCTVIDSGNSRTVYFTVRFDPLFVSPTTQNDISAFAANLTTGLNSGWINSDLNFAISLLPVLTNVSINSPTVYTNNTTRYNISVSASYPLGGANISHELALINYDGNTNGDGGHNSGDYRGYMVFLNLPQNDAAWVPDFKDVVACTGGGSGGIYTNGYGPDYIHLDSCTTSVSGNVRTTVFTVRFDTTYTTPVNNNDISGLVYADFDGSRFAGWTRFDTNFSLGSVPAPVLNNVTISDSTVNTNNSDQYDVVVDVSDSVSGSNITHEYALINYDVNTNGAGGHTSTDYRGYLGWYTDAAYTGVDTQKDKRSCTGGGIGWIFNQAPYNVYGHQYIRLDSCRTSVIGVRRTVTFTLRFDPIYLSPVANNDISAWACSTYPNCAGWTRFDTNFALASMSGPTAPNITGTAAFVLTSYPFDFTGTDVGGDQIRYGIDWNMDGTADVWSPSSGYVNSGTTRTVTHSWPTAGLQTFQALTQNTFGANSAWAQHTVNPSNGPVPAFCGVRARVYVPADTGWSPGEEYCSPVGTQDSSPAFPGIGSSVTWQCLGQSGGADSGICTATRSAGSYMLNVSVNNPSAGNISSVFPFVGTINCGATCSASIAQGEAIVLQATPASAYWQFNGWGGDCAVYGRSRQCTLNIDGAKTVTATFVPRVFNYSEF